MEITDGKDMHLIGRQNYNSAMQQLEGEEREPNKIVKYLLGNPAIRVFAFELVTCIFLLFMCFSTGFYPPFEGHPHDINPFHIIYIAIIVYSIICFSGPICGAHINAAVTLAVYSSKKKLDKGDGKVIVGYIIGQLVGCFVGIVLSKEIFEMGGPVYTEIPGMFSLMKDCVEEFIGTFMLITFIFILNTEDTTFIYDQAWVHLLIGIVYYFCLSFSTHLHILNPSIVLMVQIQGMIYDSNIEMSAMGGCLCLIAAELLAAFFAQLVFSKLYLLKMQAWKKQLS